MKKNDFLVVRNDQNSKDAYIRPETIDAILTGVLKIDPTGKMIIGGGELCAIVCKNGLNVRISKADAMFVIKKVCRNLIRRPLFKK